MNYSGKREGLLWVMPADKKAHYVRMISKFPRERGLPSAVITYECLLLSNSVHFLFKSSVLLYSANKDRKFFMKIIF